MECLLYVYYLMKSVNYASNIQHDITIGLWRALTFAMFKNYQSSVWKRGSKKKEMVRKFE